MGSVEEAKVEKQWLRGASGAGMLLGMVVAGLQTVAAQSVTPVPKLDLNRFAGVWYQVARLPNKAEKSCTGQPTVLYALGDKANSFQMGTFCQGKNDVAEETDSHGKQDKSGNGLLKVSHLVLLSTKYDVFAIGAAYEWALVGTPNHKSLSVLYRNPVIAPDLMAQLESKASAEGFHTEKLVKPAQPHNAVDLSTSTPASSSKH